VVALADFLRASNRKVRRIFLTGASEGGLVTALAAEQFPQSFSGAFSTCGPIGDFQGQIQYWGNFRVGYDTAFPTNPLVAPVGFYGPSTPIYIDPILVQNWEAVAAYIANDLMTNPASGAAAVGLLDALGIPYDSANLTTVGESLLGLLYYNVEATNDGRMTLVPGTTLEQLASSNAGNPYILPPMTSPVYPSGFEADPLALAEIAGAYQTTAGLSIPMVIMHTSGDPIVPAWHAAGYLRKAIAQHTLLKYVTYLPVDRYGHCNFTPAEMVLGFYVMVLRATLQPFSEAQIQAALPDAQWQAEFKQLKAKHKEK
jgi:pimeloyl-ACP methyl ester carboxylesterase